MKTKKRSQRFCLREIERFDARRGYKRYPAFDSVAGPYGQRPMADLWWKPNGDLVGRLSCAGERFWFKATRATGGPIRQKDVAAFEDYLCDVVLLGWVLEGVHEVDCISDWVP